MNSENVWLGPKVILQVMVGVRFLNELGCHSSSLSKCHSRRLYVSVNGRRPQLPLRYIIPALFVLLL